MNLSRQLYDEMTIAAANVRKAHFAQLSALGVEPMAIGRIGARNGHSIGIAHVREARGGLFEFDPSGSPACVIAVRDPDCWDGADGFFDLVAFRSGQPAHWLRRTGEAFALGQHLLEYGDPVPLVATPADWLAASGEAVCLLDWSRSSPAWRHLRSGPRLIIKSPDLQTELRRKLIEFAPLPEMELAA
ncbi:MAG: hypothetical protein CL801_08455 [Citromicrobium sp.]|nr:hypothetical protein [Citromicrobium sp.]|tara:strand:- start:634 stop:1197 length:564 start_codon:yes stop_codon:yes gene_type:complete